MAIGTIKERPYLALVLLTSIGVVGFVDRIIMNVLAEPLKQEFSLSDTQLGIVTGLAFAVLNVGLGLVVARIAERRRRIALIWVGTVLWSAATAVCGLAASYVQLLLARIGVGVGEAVGLPATYSVVSDYFPREKRATMMAALNLAPPLGAFIGASGGALIAQLYGWRAALFVAAVPGLILALLLALFVAEPRRGRHDGPAGASDTVPPLGAVIGRYLRWPTMRNMLMGSSLAGMVGFGLNAFLAAYLIRRFDFTLVEAGLVAGLVASLPATLSILGSGWLADRLASRGNPRAYALMPAITLCLVGPLYAFAITRDEPALIVVLVGLCGIIQYTYLGPTQGTFQNMLSPRMRATGTAFTSMIYTLVGGGFGPLLLGAVSDGYAARGTDPGLALGFAMASMAAVYLWASAHYWLASRTIEADLARPI
ncbi:major facilitator superfamily protein [Sphingobium sp. SYK-6]|uniref:MFS transporter n=1 Tax=Sphingobium sp. (strain NBRC 103272 / SYK-6) TaxID=627192 RepID=UPI0002276FF8|nr:MFS transporter [Sphingobium sp. SYK-6]BAK66312.1 major facilitator superfamily protein [Sphingobium sp. SYK-6]